MFPERRTTLSSEDVVRLSEQQRAAMPDASDLTIQFGVACEVAMILLGQRVFHAVFLSRADPHFGSFDGSGDRGDYVYMQRVVTLGRDLFECQSVENFDTMRDDMVS